jgi:hypothetical protein
MATLYIENASQSTQPKDSQKYAGMVPISMFGPPYKIVPDVLQQHPNIAIFFPRSPTKLRIYVFALWTWRSCHKLLWKHAFLLFICAPKKKKKKNMPSSLHFHKAQNAWSLVLYLTFSNVLHKSFCSGQLWNRIWNQWWSPIYRPACKNINNKHFT